MQHPPQRRDAALQPAAGERPAALAPAEPSEPPEPLVWIEGEGGPDWPSLLGQHVDQRWLRRINRAVVLACLRQHGPLSRVAIAERTALSRTTVSAITNALLREGVIREGERLPASTLGGRRAVLLHARACPESAPATPTGAAGSQ